MSSLVVVTFDAPDEATAVLESLRGQTQYGNISFEDTAVVSKDRDGKVHIKNNVSQGTMLATGVGALLGLLLTFLAFPVAGLLLGGAGGALFARFRELGVDGKFVRQVSASLQPGRSALFMLLHDADPEVVRVVLQEHHGQILHTTLTPEADATLKRALY